MSILAEWIRRLGYLIHRRKLEDELRREMESHRALMGEPQTFGNLLRLREEAQDAWGWRWLDDLVSDTRFAWRTLRHSPGFACTAIVTLALGIGVNTAMFTLVNGVLLRPLYDRSGDVVAISSRSTTPDGKYRGISYPNYIDLRDGTASLFVNLAASSMEFVGVDAGNGARRTLVARVTSNYFDLFANPLNRGAAPLALGRPFSSEEERLGGDAQVAIVSHALWRQRGSDPSVLGGSVRVNGEQFTIIGVAAEGFTGPGIPGPEVWMPIGGGARDAHALAVIGRLRDGVSIDSIAPALVTVGRRLEQAFPDVNRGYAFEISTPMRLLFMPGPGSGTLTATIAALLMLMPAIVLLVACLNLANLLLARGQVRRRELAIRSSLGGGRSRLTRQLLTEGLLLSITGGAAGLLLSKWATGVLIASLSPVLPASVNLPVLVMDWRVLVGTLAFCLVAVVVFGAWPAWNLTGRATVSDLKRHIAEEGRQPRGMWISRTLVIVQVALSLLLLASGGLFSMSAVLASTADPGFRLAGGLLVEIDPSLAGYDDERARQTQLTMVERLRTVPGIEAVTIGSDFPFSSMSDSRKVATADAANADARAVDAVFNIVGRDYARVLGFSTLAGRDFSEAELMPTRSERVAIVDDALAQHLWPGESGLGRLIQFLDNERPETRKPIRVVGIVPTLKHSLGDPRPFPHVYVPLGQDVEDAMTLQLRVADENAERELLGTVARVIHEVDAGVPILRRETWRDHVHEGFDVWLYRAAARVFLAFGAIALLLAIMGVYGVKSYVVAGRTREFGIRLATGAPPRALLWQVLWEDARTTVLGIGLGLLLAVGAGQILQGFLYGVHSIEPLVLITAPLVLLASSLLASLIPARRATRVDPIVALRSE